MCNFKRLRLCELTLGICYYIAYMQSHALNQNLICSGHLLITKLIEIEIWNESEGEFCDDDDDNNVDIKLSRIENAVGEIFCTTEETNAEEKSNVDDLRSLKQKYLRTTWKQKEFPMNLITGQILKLSGPCSSFTYFFSDELMNSIV